jgi:hypothetical protein
MRVIHTTPMLGERFDYSVPAAGLALYVATALAGAACRRLAAEGLHGVAIHESPPDDAGREQPDVAVVASGNAVSLRSEVAALKAVAGARTPLPGLDRWYIGKYFEPLPAVRQRLRRR